MDGFVKIATLTDIPENSVRAFEHEGQRIAIYRIGQQLYATSDICSHAYAELSEGFLEPDDCTIECPLHGSRFDLQSGKPLSLPAFEPIKTYPVQNRDGDIFVGI